MSTFKEEDGLRAHGLVREKYAVRLREVQEKIEHLQKSRRLLLSVTAFATLIAIAAFAAGYTSFAVVMGVAGLFSFAQRMRAGQRWGSLEREYEYFERGLARMSAQWEEFEERGDTFTRKDHLYQRDLHVLGEGSLFQLLCTTRTRAGAERLAVYLLDPVEHAESVRRQEAIQELRDAPELREKIAGLGKYRSQECAPDAFEAWFSMPVLQLYPVLRLLMLLCSSAAFLVGMSVQSKILPWAGSWPWIACLLVLPLCIAGWFSQKVRERAEALRPLTSAATLLFEGISLLETQRFNAPKLQEMVQRLQAAGASASLRKLTRILGAFEQRDKPYFSFTMLLAAGTQIVLLAERWRRRYQHTFVEGISGWAEFEALEAIAGFAYEHPEWVFPELCEGGASFEAIGLGHPLLPAHHCVCNDVRLDKEDRYLLISGSNMAGKSTLLRAMGLNTVLAYAGGPVCAKSARIAQMRICTSISVGDSLLSGRSKFFVETERLSVAIQRAREGKPVIFLVDEILSGTNSVDREIVASAFLEEMLAGDTVGALTTHDLSLTKIAMEEGSRGLLVHMESNDPDDPLHFDYKVKAGISAQSSAVAIARMMGIDGVSKRSR